MSNKLDKYIGNPGLAGDLNRYYLDGVMIEVGTSGYVQGAGAGGNTRVRVDINPGLIRLPGADGDDANPVLSEIAAAADVDAINAVVPLLAGQDMFVDQVYYRHFTTGVLTRAFVLGTPAADGTSVPPTNAQVTAAVGDRNPWLRVARIRVRRTGDAVLAVTFDNTVRPLGVQRALVSGAVVRHTSDL